MKWSPTMYRLFAFMALDEVFKSCNCWNPQEAKIIKTAINEYQSRLNSRQLNLVKFRVRKARNNYQNNLIENFQHMYWKEIDRGEELIPPVDYDDHVYDVWTTAVRQRKSVKMIHESTTSGMTERIVDPYKTRTPYGIGFCHTRHEERKFRFDRIIEITLTDNSFIKPQKRI